MKGQLHIDQVFAFIMRDEDGTEGVCGFLARDGVWMPLVGADLAKVEELKPMAKLIAKVNRKPITLAYFSNRSDIEIITADPAPPQKEH